MFRQFFAVFSIFLWGHMSLSNYCWTVECLCLSYFFAFPFTFPQNDLLKSLYLTHCSLTCTPKWVVLFRTNPTTGEVTGLLFLKCPGLFNRTGLNKLGRDLWGCCKGRCRCKEEGIWCRSHFAQLCSSRVSPCMWRLIAWQMAPVFQDATAFSCAVLELGIGWTFFTSRGAAVGQCWSPLRHVCEVSKGQWENQLFLQ